METSVRRLGPQVLLATPIPPMATGLATYALRVLEYTSHVIPWKVAYPEGGDPESLPAGVQSIPLGDLTFEDLPSTRFFALGNSPHCYDILLLLRRFGGAAVMHETVLHHMLRHCSLERDRWEDYLQALVFEYGPGAKRAQRTLNRRGRSQADFDSLLKSYPLVGRAVNASRMLLCLNCHAAAELRGRAGVRPVLQIGHPLSPVEDPVPQSPPGSPVIGMAGSFHFGRNLQTVVEAVGRLRGDHPKAVLVLAGGGYPQGLPEWVVCTGRLPEAEYQGWIRSFDIGVDVRHPSCGETSGSLLEVMRAGVPCVVSDSGAFACLPSASVLRLPAEGLERTLQRSLARLLDQPRRAELLGEKAMEYARREGSASRAVEDWTRAVSIYPHPAQPSPPRPSLAAAWHDPPPGATVDRKGDAVEWVVGKELELVGPDWARGAWVSVSGHGEVNGIAMTPERRVLRVSGGVLRFTGPGRLTAVTWLGGDDG